MLNNFKNSFAVAFSDELQNKLEQNIPSRLKSIAVT